MLKSVVLKKCLILIVLLGSTQPLMAGTADFVFTVNTGLNAGADATFTIPTYGTGYKYNVDCDNDGNFEATAQTSSYVCDYTAMGHDKYDILIQDAIGDGTGFPRVRFNEFGEANEVIELINWGSGVWDSMEAAFEDAVDLVITASDVPKLSLVTSMKEMFRNAVLADPNTSDWNTANVEDMSSVFRNAVSAKPDTSKWNTANVEDMSRMFLGATMANPDTSGWNTSKVTNMFAMFEDAVMANPNTSAWDTVNVNHMGRMFKGAVNANPDTGGWNTVNVVRMFGMFAGADSANPNTSGWNTSSVVSMNGMFSITATANPDTSDWNTSNVTDMGLMFSSAKSANPDTSGWDTAEVTDMAFMFASTDVANPSTSGWDTAQVTDMKYMFNDAAMANPDTSNWDITAVTTMLNMFNGVTLPTTSYDAILENFSSQTVQPGVSFSGGNSRYCAVAAHDDLTDSNGWIITDGGFDPDPTCGDLIFRNSFDVPVETFLATDNWFSYDFALLENIKIDSYPELFAVGVDADDKAVIHFHVRKIDQQLQLRISDLDEVNFVEDTWVKNQWQNITDINTTAFIW